MTPVDSILTNIINQLSQRSAPIYLVLDDAHLIVSSDIAACINMLVAYAPSALRIVLATRSELPLELAHMKMKGHVVSLGDSDLRFSLEETEDYLANVCGLDLAVSAVVALHGVRTRFVPIGTLRQFLNHNRTFTGAPNALVARPFDR